MIRLQVYFDSALPLKVISVIYRRSVRNPFKWLLLLRSLHFGEQVAVPTLDCGVSFWIPFLLSWESKDGIMISCKRSALLLYKITARNAFNWLLLPQSLHFSEVVAVPTLDCGVYFWVLLYCLERGMAAFMIFHG